MAIYESTTPPEFIQALLEKYLERGIEEIDNWSCGVEKEDRALYDQLVREVTDYIVFAKVKLGIVLDEAFLAAPFWRWNVTKEEERSL
jgi:hypothetical protein